MRRVVVGSILIGMLLGGGFAYFGYSVTSDNTVARIATTAVKQQWNVTVPYFGVADKTFPLPPKPIRSNLIIYGAVLWITNPSTTPRFGKPYAHFWLRDDQGNNYAPPPPINTNGMEAGPEGDVWNPGIKQKVALFWEIPTERHPVAIVSDDGSFVLPVTQTVPVTPSST